MKDAESVAIALGRRSVVSLVSSSLEASGVAALQLACASWFPFDWSDLWLIWSTAALSRFKLQLQPFQIERNLLSVLAGYVQQLMSWVHCNEQLAPQILSRKQADVLICAASSALSSARQHRCKFQLQACVSMGRLTCDVIVQPGSCGPGTAYVCSEKGQPSPQQPLLLPVIADGEECNILLDFAFDHHGTVYLCAEIIYYANKPQRPGAGQFETEQALDANDESMGCLDDQRATTKLYSIDVKSVCQEAKLMVSAATICTDGEWRPTSGLIYFAVSASGRVDVPVVLCVRELPPDACDMEHLTFAEEDCPTARN
eukprot:TRINITY_DN80475_c0_g1_i1.p1 TRINITY_DN80475_c0_g1~~TRINITY_DN80475_c0_g1_i1.p1  ORF type:complete len:315 (-),score=46.02 TRINITY_DN80475_c0_g1_i1:884-1828(-)